MQKSLECSQQTLHETTENLKQANCAIRERDYVIANQSETEKALVSRAGELREELEATVQDVAGLFAKIGEVSKFPIWPSSASVQLSAND